MKRRIFVTILTAILITLSLSSAVKMNATSDVNKVYETMILAESESRDLTPEEVTLIEKWQFDNVSLNKDDFNHAVHAMYFNFYETLGEGEAIHFNIAKNTAEVYLK